MRLHFHALGNHEEVSGRYSVFVSTTANARRRRGSHATPCISRNTVFARSTRKGTAISLSRTRTTANVRERVGDAGASPRFTRVRIPEAREICLASELSSQTALPTPKPLTTSHPVYVHLYARTLCVHRIAPSLRSSLSTCRVSTTIHSSQPLSSSQKKNKMAAITTDPALAFNEEDGTAVDPIAFRDALIADPDKLKVIEEDKELAAALLSDDTARIQATLKKLYANEKRYNEQSANDKMNSSDILRAGCSTPRDVTVLYENMLKVGLQYGPSFRLLSQVWVPDEIAEKQNEQGREETA